MIALISWLACGQASSPQAVPSGPLPIDGTTCAVCGMDLPGQPAPRGQARYRDGTSQFACSIGDLRVWLQTPNPLGEPRAVFVERSPDATTVTREAQPFVPAEQAWFVFGVDRPLVMGLAALVFTDRGSAEAAASSLGTHPVSWELVRTVPFNEIPFTEVPFNEVPSPETP